MVVLSVFKLVIQSFYCVLKTTNYLLLQQAPFYRQGQRQMNLCLYTHGQSQPKLAKKKSLNYLPWIPSNTFVTS